MDSEDGNENEDFSIKKEFNKNRFWKKKGLTISRSLFNFRIRKICLFRKINSFFASFLSSVKNDFKLKSYSVRKVLKWGKEHLLQSRVSTTL
jgi:hypothetical protein